MQQNTNPETLPLNKNVAIYRRRAAPERTTKEVDLLALARQLGWHDEQIMPFDQDNGQPGSTPLEEREGGRKLLAAIKEGIVKAIFIAEEHRVFRNANATQIAAFIQLCAEHDVVVVTPTMTYTMRDPQQALLFHAALEAPFIVSMKQKAEESF